MCGCKDRRRLLGQMGSKIVRGQSISGEVKQFGQSVRKDASAVARAINPRLIRRK
jgi:hypothetical protein